ncbi:MAG TPA: hypothetical protein PKX14_12645 [Thauera aminoaromatica]|nr:hypothetical protein [Thauera aminoaromatica]HMV93746.1 hypothetical protein [Thauera aminoaromatica]HNB06374.1 hypothetical protein [Thauera aminoaromatica]HNC67515.1 hypothetical protein [Thauera aminoaromatica]HND59191.1 hypothetical protein [Thauera aminoaromatica]HNF77635.1 hypothetical protein [Thauera aminoaromatica]
MHRTPWARAQVEALYLDTRPPAIGPSVGAQIHGPGAGIDS